MFRLRKREIGAFFLVGLTFLASTLVYPYLPEVMDSHWNIEGQPDGQVPRFWGAYLMPLLLLGLASIFILVPRIDPLRENIAEFRPFYDGFVLCVVAFMGAIYAHTMAWSLGFRINPSLVLLIGMSILFLYSSFLLANSRRNWFIGIRTPWTLSSDVVWAKTHRIGAWLFRGLALLSLVALLLPQFGIIMMLAALIIVAIVLVIYSYFAYQSEETESR